MIVCSVTKGKAVAERGHSQHTVGGMFLVYYISPKSLRTVADSNVENARNEMAAFHSRTRGRNSVDFVLPRDYESLRVEPAHEQLGK